jgi:alginate O-acetyltransferase complex protein AlgI
VIYSSPEFLLLFPFFCALYWLIRGRWRLPFLLLASFGFYVYGEPAGLPLLLVVITLVYLTGLLLERYPARAAAIAVVSIAALLAILGYFKYLGFFASVLGFAVPDVFLPLGLSFFTFEAIAYIADVRRGVTTVERSPLRVALYIALFPHLISGPIMRANDLFPQLRQRISWHLPIFTSGLQLFVEGFVKKVVIADRAAVVADRVFAAPNEMSTIAAWLGALAYTVEIYGDFAGYTDMGRGIARMLGLELPLNFNAPYAATSISDFWRRWHISLSSWLRDYLYISLGGSRHGHIRTYANLIATMLLGGLWHGAGWTFVVWGGYHGALLALERRFPRLMTLPPPLGGALTLWLVINGWVLFRARSAQVALEMYRAMYLPRGGESPGLVYAVATIVFFVIVVGAMWAKRAAVAARLPRIVGWRRGTAYGLLAGATLTVLALTAAPRPFIYFRF